MIGMQYTFPLPDDYDMDILRSRVAERGSLFDRMEGLHQKAFLTSSKGVYGASENRYAPFYQWNYSDAMTSFLVGDKFKGVSEAFGRPAVSIWLSLYHSTGRAVREKPVFATREIMDIMPGTDLEQMRKHEYKLHRIWAEHPENQSGFIGLDSCSWKPVRFALWTRPQERFAAGTEAFEVLHLSAPSLNPEYLVSPC
jgi:hypothetical protein